MIFDPNDYIFDNESILLSENVKMFSYPKDENVKLVLSDKKICLGGKNRLIIVPLKQIISISMGEAGYTIHTSKSEAFTLRYSDDPSVHIRIVQEIAKYII